jgi:hypothetical protein
MTADTAVQEIRPGDASQYSGGQMLVDRIRFISAMVVAGGIFWYVGWWACGPIDPLGPVSLLMVRQGVVSMAELLGLAVVASGLAVAICGSGAADRGPLAVAVGLAAMGSRGTQLDSLVLFRLHPQTAQSGGLEPFPITALVAETWLWLALIAVGFVVGRWVSSWYEMETGRTAEQIAIKNAPTDVRAGLGALILSSLVAWSIISFAVGSEAGPLLKGQIYFALVLAFVAGSAIGNGLFRVNSPAWALAAVALVATAAYLIASPDSVLIETARRTGTQVTLPPAARPLPIEYAALGAAGVLIEKDVMRMLRALIGLPAQENA